MDAGCISVKLALDIIAERVKGCLHKDKAKGKQLGRHKNIVDREKIKGYRKQIKTIEYTHLIMIFGQNPV